MARLGTVVSPDIPNWDEFREKVWPDTTYLSGAEKASRYGCWAAGLLAALALIVAGSIASTVGIWSGVVHSSFLALVWIRIAKKGIYRKSMLAASAGLVLWLVLRVWMWVEFEPTAPIETVFFTWLFVIGWRGTVRWHELRLRQVLTA